MTNFSGLTKSSWHCSMGKHGKVIDAMFEHCPECLELVAEGNKKHLPDDYERGDGTADVRDDNLRIHVRGPESNEANFKDDDRVGDFRVSEHFTLLRIMTELVEYENPLHFNPPLLEKQLVDEDVPTPKKPEVKKCQFSENSFGEFVTSMEDSPETQQEFIEDIQSLVENRRMRFPRLTEEELGKYKALKELILSPEDIKAQDEDS